MLTVAALAATMSSRVARAEGRVHARLTYGPDAEIERCPTERELRDAVAVRLGYDPFEAPPEPDPSAPEGREVIVQVHKRGTGIVGSMELRGPHPGQRELASPRGDCREVLDSFAVAIAIGLDPSSLTRPVGDPPPATLPPSMPPGMIVPSTPPADHPVGPPEPKEPIDVRVGGGPVVAFGELPAIAPAVALSVGVRWRWVEPILEGFATLPVSQPSGGGSVTASLLTVGLFPCGHADMFFACVGLTLGTLRGEGEGAGIGGALQGNQLYSSASARGGVELAVTRLVWVRGYAEAVVPTTRITLQLASQDVWRMPSVAARVGVAAGVRF
jgi:hypothetical protein